MNGFKMRKFSLSRFLAGFTETFGLGRGMAVSGAVLISLVAGFTVFLFFHSAPPTSITITSGPAGSVFMTNAQKYATILARNGVKLKILESRGSRENLERLQNPRLNVQLGFVQGGVTNGASFDKLVSLGSLFYEPLFLFYRGEASLNLLSDLAGKRLAIGPSGSGTRSLALTLLQTNGITDGGATVEGARLTLRFARPDAAPFYAQVVTNASGTAEMNVQVEEKSLSESSVVVQASFDGRTATRKFQMRAAI